MKAFMDQNFLLDTPTAQHLYHDYAAKMPICDYHCHIPPEEIYEDRRFENIAQVWLGGHQVLAAGSDYYFGDHYKWRAMRLCGVDEEYITGRASFHDKFIKYAQILPQLVGNPLYYWSHLELKQIFGICEPLNAESVERIWVQANEKLKDLRVQDLLRQFKVEYVATTDDPTSNLSAHGKYGNTTVAPTFRPDKLYSLDGEYLQKLGKAAGVEIKSLDDLL